ncbi:MAG: response regulator [Dehalococcoidales bacterium]|nr:response regulator [Dehalococcoidales bacterium]
MVEIAKKRVLVIDDEPRILHFVKVSLSIAGYEVITTTSGEEGITLASSAKPDIMLLDVMMAPMNGFEVLAKLRLFSRLPVIIFTGRSDIGALALKEGANGFIAKPFNPQDLIRKIKDTFGLTV